MIDPGLWQSQKTGEVITTPHIGSGIVPGQGTKPRLIFPVRSTDFFSTGRYINERLPQDATFGASKPIALYCSAGRRSVPCGTATLEEDAGFIPYLRRAGARCTLRADLLSDDAIRLAPLLEANCRHLLPVERFAERTILFRMLSEDGPDDSGRACAGTLQAPRTEGGLVPEPPP